MGRQKRTRKRMGKGKKRPIDKGEDQKGRKETRKLNDEQQAKEKFWENFILKRQKENKKENGKRREANNEKGRELERQEEDRKLKMTSLQGWKIFGKI